MKLILLLLLSLVAVCVCQDDYYLTGYKLYLLNNATYTTVDILAQSNTTKFWGVLNQMEFTSNLTNFTAGQNKSVGLIMGNETVEPFYYEHGGQMHFNHS